MRLHDRVVVRFCGVDVVVVGIDPGVAKPLGLPVLQQAEAGADLHLRVLTLDRADHVGDPFDVLVRRTTTAGHHADPGRTAAQPGSRLVERLVGLEPGVLQDVGRRPQRLRAVVAVLRAQPRLEVDQVVDLDRVAEVLAPQPFRPRRRRPTARRRGHGAQRARRPRWPASPRGCWWRAVRTTWTWRLLARWASCPSMPSRSGCAGGGVHGRETQGFNGSRCTTPAGQSGRETASTAMSSRGRPSWKSSTSFTSPWTSFSATGPSEERGQWRRTASSRRSLPK